MAATKLSQVGNMAKLIAPKVEAVVGALSTEEIEDIMRSKRPASNKTAKSFKLNIGGFISIPTKDAQARPMYSHPANAKTNGLTDPFEGLPFRNFAERVGGRIAPAIEAAREEQRNAMREGRAAAESFEPVQVPVPHFLPFTRWASSNQTFKSTFIADDPSVRKKARLSWYHPDDTMVPRGWFTQGLMEDIKYYMPFGLGAGSSNDTSSTRSTTSAS